MGIPPKLHAVCLPCDHFTGCQDASKIQQTTIKQDNNAAQKRLIGDDDKPCRFQSTYYI